MRLTSGVEKWSYLLLTETMTALCHCAWLWAVKCHHVLLTETMTTVFHLTIMGVKLSRLLTYWKRDYTMSLCFTVALKMSASHASKRSCRHWRKRRKLYIWNFLGFWRPIESTPTPTSAKLVVSRNHPPRTDRRDVRWRLQLHTFPFTYLMFDVTDMMSAHSDKDFNSTRFFLFTYLTFDAADMTSDEDFESTRSRLLI